MENIKLEIGKCAICLGPIDEDWAGKEPALGTVCRMCSNKKPEPEVFGVKNIEFQVERTLIFDPFMGEYEYHFDFKDSKIMVNDKIGVIISTQGDASWVRFSDEDRLGDFVKGLGYRDLTKLYRDAGFDLNPPILSLPKCPKDKIPILDKPIAPVIVKYKDLVPEGKIVTAIYIGDEFGYKGNKIPFIETLHAFANLYTRYKFGLASNYCFEGGFVGKGFEIRNLVGSQGISINMDPMGLKHMNFKNMEDLKELGWAMKIQVFANMLYDREQSRPEVAKKDADIDEVLFLWTGIMETLLRYDWTKEKMDTVEDIWHNYCIMQGILRNILPEKEIKESLEYAKGHKMVHYGISY